MLRSCLLLVVRPDEPLGGLLHPALEPPLQLLHHLLLQPLILLLMPGVPESSLGPWSRILPGLVNSTIYTVTYFWGKLERWIY